MDAGVGRLILHVPLRVFALLVVVLAAAPMASAGGEDNRTRLEEAVHAYYYGSREEALRLLRPLAEAGCAKAQAKLAGLYDQEPEHGGDPEKAVKWYQRAADNGNAEAQDTLAFLYDYGKYGLGPRDYENALKWHRRATDQGHPMAMYHLGRMYLKGLGVERDVVEAYKWIALSIPRFPPPTDEPAHGVGFNHEERAQTDAFRQRLAQSMSRLALTLAEKKAQAWEEEHDYMRHMPETADEPIPLWFNRIEGRCDD